MFFSRSKAVSLAITLREDAEGGEKFAFTSPKAYSRINAAGIAMLRDVFLVFFFYRFGPSSPPLSSSPVDGFGEGWG